MKNRKKYLKKRKTEFKWSKIGMRGSDTCPNCGERIIIQIYKYDSWACISCNMWLEETCGDSDCPFCSNRPKTPYEAYWNNNIYVNNSQYIKMWRRDNYKHKKTGEIRHNKRNQNELKNK